MPPIDYIQIHHKNTNLLDRVAVDVFDEPILLERLFTYLENSANLLIVAVTDGVVIGQVAAVLHRHPDRPTDLYIDNLGVTPEYQRQAIATRLIKEIVTCGKMFGCEEVWLATEIDNTAARALYVRYAKAQEIVMYSWGLDREVAE
jgi:ribosomal protein S18 acetylase RimI-like enzyme